MSMLDGSITSRRTGKQWKITFTINQSIHDSVLRLLLIIPLAYLGLEVVSLNRKKNILQLDSDWGKTSVNMANSILTTL